MGDLFNFSVNGLDAKEIKDVDEFVREIDPILQEILNETFPNDIRKRTIKHYRDRISFACPICGDSAKDSSKKRGNIILTGKFPNRFKCHNCGRYMTIPEFLKHFKKNMSLGAISYVQQTQELPKFTPVVPVASAMFDNEKIDSFAVSREEFKTRLGLVETTENNAGTDYLRKRLQNDHAKFLYHVNTSSLFILNLTASGKIIGFQIRHMAKNYKGPKYKTYNASKLHEIILKDNVEVPADIDTLSMVFNILLADYKKPVMVTEGPMDAFLLPNSIALCGASKTIPVVLDYRFVYDDDETGRKHALEMLNKGMYVLLWSKLKRDLDLPIREKWDVNDVLLWCYQNKKQFPKFGNYFSNDPFDALMV